MKNRYFTLWLALICIVLFVLQLIIPGLTDSLLLNQQSFSQPYRFVTSIFLHADYTHILFNLFALVLFGLILEKFIGSKRFLIVFLVSGVLANIVSVFFYPASLGASGAIMGILGCLTIIRPGMVVFVYSMPMPMFLAAIIWTAGDIIGVFNPSGVGNIAHLSGLAIGLISGIYLRKKHLIKQEIKANYSRVVLSEQNMRNWEDRHMS